MSASPCVFMVDLSIFNLLLFFFFSGSVFYLFFFAHFFFFKFYFIFKLYIIVLVFLLNLVADYSTEALYKKSSVFSHSSFKTYFHHHLIIYTIDIPGLPFSVPGHGRFPGYTSFLWARPPHAGLLHGP